MIENETGGNEMKKTFRVFDGSMVLNVVEAVSEIEAIRLAAEGFGYEDMDEMAADTDVDMDDIRAECFEEATK
jgi:hypothetical protein